MVIGIISIDIRDYHMKLSGILLAFGEEYIDAIPLTWAVNIIVSTVKIAFNIYVTCAWILILIVYS